MYPRVPIVVLEPEPANCWLLQANTRVFANVRVKCAGLWDKVRHRPEPFCLCSGTPHLRMPMKGGLLLFRAPSSIGNVAPASSQ